MRTIIIGVAAAGLLAACSGETETEPQAEAPANALQPGEYELSTKVDAIRSTDNTTPASESKAGGEPAVTRTCIPADGKPDPAAFAEAGESCTPMDTYLRGGRMSLQYKCNRSGKGMLTQLVDGNFKKDSFEAKGTTATYFSGTGDYEMVRSFTGRRVGECSAVPAPAAG